MPLKIRKQTFSSQPCKKLQYPTLEQLTYFGSTILYSHEMEYNIKRCGGKNMSTGNMHPWQAEVTKQGQFRITYLFDPVIKNVVTAPQLRVLLYLIVIVDVLTLYCSVLLLGFCLFYHILVREVICHRHNYYFLQSKKNMVIVLECTAERILHMGLLCNDNNVDIASQIVQGCNFHVLSSCCSLRQFYNFPQISQL